MGTKCLGPQIFWREGARLLSGLTLISLIIRLLAFAGALHDDGAHVGAGHEHASECVCGSRPATHPLQTSGTTSQSDTEQNHSSTSTRSTRVSPMRSAHAARVASVWARGARRACQMQATRPPAPRACARAGSRAQSWHTAHGTRTATHPLRTSTMTGRSATPSDRTAAQAHSTRQLLWERTGRYSRIEHHRGRGARQRNGEGVRHRGHAPRIVYR